MGAIKFDVVSIRAKKRLPCPTCKAPVRRATRFEQTLNPFNRDAEGKPKTAQQVRIELGMDAAKWKATPEACAKCSTAAA